MTRLGAFSLAVVVLSAVAGGMFGGRVLAGGSRLSDHLRLYTAIVGAVEQEYVDEVKSDRLVSASIREMLRTLDPHSNFFEAKEYSNLQERQKGSYYGLGITVQSVDGNITVVSPFEGTPAHRLGIRAGDVISKIEDEDARGMSIDDAVKRLRGPKGTPVHITIVRQGYDAPLEFTVIRDSIPLHSVPYYFMASKSVGYVRLTDFNETTACRPGEGHGLRAGARARPQEPAEERGHARSSSTSGTTRAGCSTSPSRSRTCSSRRASWWSSPAGAPSGTSRTTSPRRRARSSTCPWSSSRRATARAPPRSWPGPSRTTTAALIVGETTFGKGLVQTIMPLRNVRGYALALTTARYYTPSGRSIQRDYGSTALEDYYAPQDRKPCDAGDERREADGRRPQGLRRRRHHPRLLRRARRRPRSSSPTSIGRQAFVNFARSYEASEGQRAAPRSRARGQPLPGDVGQGPGRRPRLQGRRRR